MPTKKSANSVKKTKKEQPLSSGVGAFLDMTQDIGFSAIGSTDVSDVQDYLPTFIPSLDTVTGGGIPFRRLSEVYGSPGAGKSTFLVYMTSIASQLGVPVIWIDTEGTTGTERMSGFDIDNNYVRIFNPDQLGKDEIMSIERIDNIIETVMQRYIDNDAMSNVPAIILWDGIAVTITEEEAHTAITEEGRRGRQASAVTKLVKRITPKLSKCNLAILVTNQVRANMDAMNPYAKKTKKASSIKALEHAESLQISLDKLTPLKGMTSISRGVIDNNGNNKTGHVVKFTIDKSKDGVNEQFTKLNIFTSSVISTDPYINMVGLDFCDCVYTDAVGAGIIKNAGGYKKFVTSNGELITKRESELLTMLHEDDELMKDLYAQTLMYYLPYRYPAMQNKNIDITKFKYWSDTLTKKYKNSSASGRL